MKKHKKRSNKKRRPPHHTKKSRIWKLIEWDGLAIIAVMATVFGSTLMFKGISIPMGLAIGLFVAFAGLPHCDPQKWKPRPIVCAILGGAIAGVFAFSVDASWYDVTLSGTIGTVVGFFATKWVPHISV